DFIENTDKYKDYILYARIKNWTEKKCYPLGEIVDQIVDKHTIDSRTNIILKNNNIQYYPFYRDIMEEIPENDWEIPYEEYGKRLDLRKECIFTIDPPAAKDLDDALSCKILDNGCFEVGIHIADVSYFVKPNSCTDKEALKRGTSTYLVQKVIPMLPRNLCENLCSLNPGKSRLAFSVIVMIDLEGRIITYNYKKSIICSCAKLSYNHVQRVIDSKDQKWPKENDDVIIQNPYHQYSFEDIMEKINILYILSSILKKNRKDKGAISLNKKKLWFDVQAYDYIPTDFGIFEPKEANSLVEEYMLLANIIVAKELFNHYFNEALLRHHEKPDKYTIEKFLTFIRMTDKIKCDIDNSNGIHDFLSSIINNDSFYSDVALLKCIKSMKRAQYTCSTLKFPNKLFHFGLHVPYYTHFTSPIRRYPDIIVHRQLNSILNHNESSPYSRKEIFKITKMCNDNKYNAKVAQESSVKLYLIYLLHDYIKKKQIKCVIEDAIVIGFNNHSLEFTIPKFAYEGNIYIQNLCI
ncbi:hypothetical protein PIROE2DRAFT_25604, partial [Piromyces sp. E2]